jgi:hypothetical protein
MRMCLGTTIAVNDKLLRLYKKDEAYLLSFLVTLKKINPKEGLVTTRISADHSCFTLVVSLVTPEVCVQLVIPYVSIGTHRP